MTAWLKDQFNFWVSSEFFAVGLSAFAGVGIRVAIENYFADHMYTVSFGAFTNLFFTSSYLTPNLIGCFIMSVCIANMKALTDVGTPLYKFLTTGLCGCITTYSSWLNVTVYRSLTPDDWYGMPVRILLEGWLTWGAFTFGFTFQKLCVEFYQAMQPKIIPKPAPVTVIPTVVDSKVNPAADKKEQASENKAELKGTAGVVNPIVNNEKKEKIVVSKRSSTVRFQESEDDARMLSHDEAAALEEEMARSNTAANAGPPRPGTGQVSAFGARSSTLGLTNSRSSTVGFANARSSTMGMRNSTFANDTGRTSAWGRGSLAPKHYDTNSLFAVQEDIVLNDLAGRISVWREDGILDGDNSDGGRKSLAYRARNSTVKRPSAAHSGRQNSGGGLDLSVTSGPQSNESDPEAPPTETSAESNQKEDTPFIKFVLFCLRNEFTIWCSLFCIVAFILWALLAAGQRVPYLANASNRNTFRSVCLAPFGAWVRWAPTRLPWIKAYWPEIG
jgi:fluoride ion exporter CrcB/FEX